tara:strand:+ start:510 stop:1088 length:579 start_codon:yes stop_codon:yes gene_type:complete
MVWSKAGSTTLGSAGDLITVSSLSNNKFYMVIMDNIDTGSVNEGISMGSGSVDSGSNYASRESYNGTTDLGRTSQTHIYWNLNSVKSFHVGYINNISGEEKLSIAFGAGQNTAGAGNAPNRHETVGKWVNTSNPIDTIAGSNLGAGSFNTDSTVSVLGSDGVESLNVQDGAVYYETDTNKSYVLSGTTWSEL